MALNIETATIDELIEVYIRLRDAKEAATNEFKKSMERTNAGMAKLEGILLKRLQDSRLTSANSKSGTAYINEKNNCTVQDKEAFRNWLLETEQWEAADIKANKVAVRELLNDGADVPGVKYTTHLTVGIRRS